MPASDAELLIEIRAGNRNAYQHLVERHSRTLFRLAYRITGNEGDAEDVVQESFLRAYRNLGGFDERASFSTWIQRIASNCALDILRSRKRMTGAAEDYPEIVDHAPRPDRLTLNSQLRERLDHGMKSLSEQERSAFVLRHFEGQSISDISETLQIGESAAKHSVFRAVHKLRRFLGPALGVTG